MGVEMRKHGNSFFVLALTLSLTAVLVDCNLEGDILHAQKLAWEDPNNILKSWDPTLINPCTWYHVTCNSNNSVIRLDLGEAGFSGPILPQLGNLTNLEYLELYGNNINGTVPEELGQLRKLISMELQQNSLTGPIPSSIGNLESLKFLRLNANMLTGEIPIEILNLIRSGNLSVMNISDNYLDGTIRRSEQTGFSITTVIMDQKTFR